MACVLKRIITELGSDEFWDSFSKIAASEHKQYEFSTTSIVHKKKIFSLSRILPKWAENSQEGPQEFLNYWST